MQDELKNLKTLFNEKKEENQSLIINDNQNFDVQHSSDPKRIGRLNLELQIALNKVKTLQNESNELKEQNVVLKTKNENIQAQRKFNLNQSYINIFEASEAGQEEPPQQLRNENLFKEVLASPIGPSVEIQPSCGTKTQLVTATASVSNRICCFKLGL
ncbi:hypothetical protein PCASD_09517 [Puccinia coronata f. sp. avenae]|uniref:Uncharacterized protein n=1 Tax=Puccinia coronata f. sp. avenae TaxID=200324 RepID=A0A2N5U691_9BASI|nr:hypothetical protein PCASD_09517 [Puccinia coronata f. sp. avenae]